VLEYFYWLVLGKQDHTPLPKESKWRASRPLISDPNYVRFLISFGNRHSILIESLIQFIFQNRSPNLYDMVDLIELGTILPYGTLSSLRFLEFYLPLPLKKILLILNLSSKLDKVTLIKLGYIIRILIHNFPKLWILKYFIPTKFETSCFKSCEKTQLLLSEIIITWNNFRKIRSQNY